MNTLALYLGRMKADEWRTNTPFSDLVHTANQKLFSVTNDSDAMECLNGWLSKNQPCLFGRSASRLGLISHCILRESDILKGDEHVKERIAAARLEWTRAGLAGASSAFIITVVSPTIAMAEPDEAVKDFARRLCELYLLEEIQIDTIHMDEIFLQVGVTGAIFRWKAGVNYFAAHGDGRWWQVLRQLRGSPRSLWGSHKNISGEFRNTWACRRRPKSGAD
jgi:hypothetical protein